MINKLSLRMRITLIVGVILVVCSIALTGMFNISATDKFAALNTAILTPSYPNSEIVDKEQGVTIGNGNIISGNIDSETGVLIEVSDVFESQIVISSLVTTASRMRIESLLFCLTIIVLGTIATYYLSGKMLSPVSQLSSKIENLSENNLSEKLEIPKVNDEIADLSKAYNKMTDRLCTAFDKQKQFSANSAHELRTPLAVMQAKLEVFEKVDTDNIEDYKELVADMSKQVNRLSNLAVNLLEFNNVETVELTDDIEIYPLVEEVIYDLEEVAKGKSVQINLEGENFNLMGNDAILYRAFYNIIENAIKYNEIGGSVDVVINNNSVTVKDSGIGIPKEMKESVFDAFVRVDRARSRAMGGVGLGLYIANETFKKHNATVIISDNKPKGTIINIKF